MHIVAEDLGGVFQVGVLLVEGLQGLDDPRDVLTDRREARQISCRIELGLNVRVDVVHIAALGTVGDDRIPYLSFEDCLLVHVLPKFFGMYPGIDDAVILSKNLGSRPTRNFHKFIVDVRYLAGGVRARDQDGFVDQINWEVCELSHRRITMSNLEWFRKIFRQKPVVDAGAVFEV